MKGQHAGEAIRPRHSGALIHGYLNGRDWRKAARMGNACGAIVVTRPGCANFMAFEVEALQFIEDRGGFWRSTQPASRAPCFGSNL